MVNFKKAQKSMPKNHLVFSFHTNLKQGWGAQHRGLLTALLSNCRPPDFFHFQTCSFQTQLTQLIRLQAAPSGATKVFINPFSHMQQYSPRPVNRLWCVKSVEFPFNISSYCTFWSRMQDWTVRPLFFWIILPFLALRVLCLSLIILLYECFFEGSVLV